MITEKQSASANFIRLVAVLKQLRDTEAISFEEYYRAKKYYQKLTGADIILAD